MQQTKNIGDFIKVEGADWGAYWDGKKWMRFECLGCAYAAGVLTGKRLQRGSFLYVKLGKNNQIKHTPAIHNKWLEQGKPTKGL